MDLRGLARDEAELGPAVADTVDLVEAICGGVDEAEKAALEVAIRAALPGGVDAPACARR